MAWELTLPDNEGQAPRTVTEFVDVFTAPTVALFCITTTYAILKLITW